MGTSVTAANPKRTGDATTGLYTTGAGNVSVAIGGVQEISIDSGGLGVAANLGASGNLNVSGSGSFGNILSFPGGIGANPGFHFSSIGSQNSYGGNLGLGLDTSYNIVIAAANVSVRIVNDAGATPWQVDTSGNTNQNGNLIVNGGAAIGTGASFGTGVAIGTTSLSTGTALDMKSTTSSIALPVGTTGQRPTGIEGMIRYNSTTLAVEVFANSAWRTVNTTP